jgi:glycosyltransferase involved in cell wall biosynthesis
MKLIILTTYPFPFGMAQTNRLIAMSKGLIHAGADVKVIVTKATESPEKVFNTTHKGSYEGVPFVYSTLGTIRPSGKLKRIFWFVKGFLNAFRIISREHKSQKVDAVFMGVTFNLNTLLFYGYCKLLGIKFIQERSEYPFLSYSKSIIGRVKLGIYLKIICKLFDGFVVISKSLEAYFKPHLTKNTPVFLLPILVETERFKINTSEILPRIIYCGSMQGDKDGVPILIEAFRRIAPDYPEIQLYLIGSIEFEGFSALTEKVNEYNLEDRIVFTGRIEREQMPELLCSGLILALARPYTKQAEGGFPTKLGEYLATGRPTIVTAVGEIPDYLTHKVNALLPEPGNVDDFATNLRFALDNPELAEKIGRNGEKIANEVFNYKVQGIQLLNWLKFVCK